MVVKKSFGTHSGAFHADEITACSLLLLFGLIERDKIFRTRDEALLATCEFVCDVGGKYDPKEKRFDHHQITYQGEMSSAGMVLLYLKEQGVMDEDLYQQVNSSLVIGADAHDVGNVKLQEGFCSFSEIIENFMPIEYGSSEEEENRGFFEALDFTVGHLDRLMKRYYYIRSCREKVKEQMTKAHLVLMFDEPLPWIESFFQLGGENHPALFLIMPTGDGWKLRAIPPSYQNRMQVRLALPESWAGLREEELEKVSGIKGAVFCHKGRFISIWKTKEAAIEALKYILAEEGVEE